MLPPGLTAVFGSLYSLLNLFFVSFVRIIIEKRKMKKKNEKRKK